MEPLWTEIYNLSSPKGNAEHLMLDRREKMPGLPWGRNDNCGAPLGKGSCQKQQQQPQSQQQQLLEVGTCEDQLAHAGQCAEQRSLEMDMGLRQDAKGQMPPLQGVELLVQSKRLDLGRWRLDFESESDCEEIYWGCFYFFPWLRMWRRERRERP